MKSNRQVKIGAVLSYVQLFLSIGISLVYTPLMLNILGKSEYGLYSTISSMLAWLSLLNMGFNGSYMKFFAMYKAKDDYEGIAKVNGIFLTVFSLMGVVAFLCGTFLAYHLDYVFAKGLTDQEYSIARILTLVVTIEMAISFPATVFNSIVKSQEKFILVKSLNIVQTVMGPFVALPLLLMGYGSIGMVCATVAVNILVYCVNIWYCACRIKAKFAFRHFDNAILHSITTFSSFIMFNSIADQINRSLDKVLLGRFCGTEIVAVYTIGFSIFTYFKSFSTTFMGVLSPQINLNVSKLIDRKDELKKYQTGLLIKTARLQFYIIILIFTGFVFFGQKFIEMWAGKGFQASYYVAILLMIASSANVLQYLCIEMQRAQNKHKFRSIVYFSTAIANAMLTIVLCQKYGAIGATIGTFISELIVNTLILNVYYHRKMYIDIIAFWKSICGLFKGVIIPIIIGSVFLVFRTQSFAIYVLEIVTYSIIYVLSMYKWTMNGEEKAMIHRYVFRRSKAH